MSGRRDVLDSVSLLAELAAQYDGVLDRAEVYDLGLTSDQITWQVGARRWRTIGAHVVITHLGPLTRRADLRIANLHAGPASALAAWTGLEVAGLQRWERSDTHILVPRGAAVPTLPRLTVHESRRFSPESDVVVRAGFRTVRPARAAVDSAAWTRRPDEAVALLAAVVQQRIATVEELRVELDAAGGVRHRRHLSEHLGELDDGAEALSEVRLGRILEAAGLPRPRRQEHIALRGRSGRLDAEVDLPDGGVLVIEVDGPDHDDVRARAIDTIRDIANAGRRTVTVRITPWAMRHRATELVEAFRQLRLASARRRAG